MRCKRNASGGRIRGGSTISQQAAKNAFLWQGGGYARKGVEAWFTFLIEHLWGKRRIMEVYLNLAETGIGTYGVNAGSERYFGHDASAMSADRSGADRGGAAVAEGARRGCAEGLHPPLRQHHRARAFRSSLATGSTPASIRARRAPVNKAASGRDQEGAADPGRGIRNRQAAAPAETAPLKKRQPASRVRAAAAANA